MADSAGLMNLQIKISSDTKDAVKSIDKIGDSVEGLAQTFSNALGPLGGLITSSLTTPIGAVTVALGALAVEGKFLLEQSLEGEKLKAIDTQFQNLAKSINISADNLRSRLLVSMDGLVDGASSIQLANRAMVTLGQKAAELPRLMEIARKATAGFGGEPLQNLELLVRAIESGNTRMLRQIGLQIDSTKALKDYAKSLGTTVENLSEQGRQQAIINAITTETDRKYKNISGTLTPLADSVTRLKNNFSDVREELAKFISGNYSFFFANLFESISNGLKKINGSFSAADRIKELTGEIEKAQLAVADLETFTKKSSGSVLMKDFALPKGFELDVAKSKLASLNAEYKKLTDEVKKSNDALGKGAITKATQDTGSLINPFKQDIEYFREFARYLEDNSLGESLAVDTNYLHLNEEEFRNATNAMRDYSDAELKAMAEINNSFASGLTQGLLDFAEGTKTADQAFGDFARSFVRKITEMILQQTILNAIGGVFGPVGRAAAPAAARGLADGGYVAGAGTGTSDSIPARLSNGEYVVKAKAVKSLGVGFLNGLNNMRGGVPTKVKSGVARFAEGGFVGTGGATPQVVIQNNGTPKEATGTSFDPSSQVTTVILEDIQRNGSISKTIQNTFGVKRGAFR